MLRHTEFNNTYSKLYYTTVPKYNVKKEKKTSKCNNCVILFLHI